DDVAGMTCTGGCGATSRWALATGAINNVAGLTSSSVDWALNVFGDPGAACTVSHAVDVAPGPGTAGAVATTLAIRTGVNGGLLNGGSHRPTRAAETLAS